MFDLWQSVLSALEQSVPSASFDVFFKHNSLSQNRDGRIIISVPNIFIKKNLEGKYNKYLVEAFKRNGITPEIIEFIIGNKKDDTVKSNRTVVIKDTAKNKPNTSTKPPTGLNERYRFSNFIVGSNNDLAHSACEHIVENFGDTRYNPLFIYGGVGLGKTHLIQAAGNGLLEKTPSLKVSYITIETFYREFVDFMRKKLSGFSDKYRDLDVLIIDDMQFISGKEKSQEEFFHTFNALYQNGGQIILSADRHPSEIAGLTDRLRTRFEQGLSIDIQMPDFETRCAILEAKSSFAGVEVPRDVIEYLANSIKTNIRELEGALNKMIAYCEMRGTQPNINDLVPIINNSGKKARRQAMSPKVIIEKTAKYYSITLTEICGKNRSKNIVEPRQIAMYLLRHELDLSFPKIAVEFERDWTTAIHAVQKIEKNLAVDFSLRDQISQLREQLYV
ncbi:MAG: chromosomal replication initiator protein DnaA [Candidatus Nomurabacteria bacterium]|nr:chromosomal replication initiator protein DnaA [Candidatus Nomurabacteria bacterium]